MAKKLIQVFHYILWENPDELFGQPRTIGSILCVLHLPCAVLSCSVMSDCDSMDCSPPGSSVHEDSSPVLTCILRYFWSLPRGVSSRLEWGHARSLSSRAVAELSQNCHASLRVDQGICGFPSRLSHEAFPRGFPTRLSHEAFPQGCTSCRLGVSRSPA